MRFRTPEGVSGDATCTAVTGAGPSGYKIIDLDAGGFPAAGVKHQRDAAPGDPCWHLVEEDPTEVVSESVAEAAPVVAVEAGAETAVSLGFATP